MYERFDLFYALSMRNKRKIILTGVMALLLWSCGVKQNAYDASGIFEATEVIVSAEISGKIMEFSIEEGQKLQANTFVGYIDSTQLYLKKMQLLTNVKANETRRPDILKQIAVTEQQIATARTEQKRFENLLKSNAANQKQLDDINAQISLLEKQLTAQKSTLEKNNKGITEESSGIEIQIAQIEDQLQKCKIVSPITGVVLAKYAEKGELALQGKALFSIADIENMILRAYITSGQLTQFKLGQSVSVFTDLGEKGRKEYKGAITWISDKYEFTPKTIQTKDERANLVYAVKIAVKNDGYLKIGMYGELGIKGDQ